MEIKEELLDIEGIKKSNKPLIDLFIRRTAVLTSTQESLCEKIIKDQWQKANKAANASSQVSEMDFCNLGTFYISANKAKKRIEKLEEINKSLETAEPDPDDKINKRRLTSLQRNNDMLKAIRFKTVK